MPVTGRRRRDERGSAVVDFVFVLLLLLPLVLGILQLALVMHVRNTLAAAAAEGARAGAVLGAARGAAAATTREQIVGALDPRYARDVTVGPTTIGGAPALVVTVRAEVPTLVIGGLGFPVEVSGNAAVERLPGGVS